MAKVIIPTPLRGFTGNRNAVEVIGSTVAESIRALVDLYPELRGHLLDAEGRVNDFIRIYVGETDIREMNNERTPVGPDAQISLIPAIAGGVFSPFK